MNVGRLSAEVRHQMETPGKAILVVALGILVLTTVSSVPARALESGPGGVELVIVAGLGVFALLALALTHYEAAAVLGFALLGVVRVEPGVPDVILGTVIAVVVVTGRFRIDRLPPVIAALLGLFFVTNLVSFVDVVDTGRGIRYSVVTAYLIVFSVWLTGYGNSRQRVRALTIAYVAGAVVMAAVSILALYIGFPGSDLFLYPAGVNYPARAQGLLKDPNVYGPFLIPALLIVIEETLTPRLLRFGYTAKLGAAAILALGVFVSYSRAAWLNAAVGFTVLFVVLALRRRGYKHATTLLSALAVLAVVIVAVVAVTGSADFVAGRAQFQSYDVERFGTQRAGIGLVAQHPLGVGPGQFDVVEPQGAHSIFVRVLAEQGIAGLLAILLLLTITLSLAVSNVGRGRDTYGLGSATLLAAWCGLIANSPFVDTLHWRHLWMVAAFVWIGATITRARR